MELVKDGRRIIGFIEQQKDGSWGYAFGKPSQPSFIMFYTESRDKALERVLDNHKMFKGMLKSLRKTV